MFLVVFGIFLLVSLLLNGWLTMRIADSVGYKNRYWGFIPVLNWLIMTDIAKINRWIVLLVFIPYVGIIANIYVFYKFFNQLVPSKAVLYTVLGAFVPFAMLIIMYILPNQLEIQKED